eukprot:TRINITY_DN39900_c0_g1_i1.p1 TRINITY_DN39900_c0_g1~~TRINITY_DN39900_c0_g1_i1.p1  ORF type:complete len:324 (-),score=33.57 TRINITY_DN39900_c0_g1_i1:262-1233(-)
MPSEWVTAVKNTFISVQEDREGRFPGIERQQSEPALLSLHQSNGKPAVNEFAFVPDGAQQHDCSPEIDVIRSADASGVNEFGRVHHGLEGSDGGETRTNQASDVSTGDADARSDSDLPIEWRGKTSVMVRNLSYKCTSPMFRRELCQEGFENLFNYLYVPLNRDSRTSKGYAFINFVDAHTAFAFKEKFDANVMNIPGSRKPLEVIPAKLQGYHENTMHYHNKRLETGTSSFPSPAQCTEFFNHHCVQQEAEYTVQDTSPSPYNMEREYPTNRHPFSMRDVQPSWAGNIVSETRVRFCYNCGGKRQDAVQPYCQWCGTCDVRQ